MLFCREQTPVLYVLGLFNLLKGQMGGGGYICPK